MGNSEQHTPGSWMVDYTHIGNSKGKSDAAQRVPTMGNVGAYYPGPYEVRFYGTCSAQWPFITARGRDADYPLAELPAHLISVTGEDTYDEAPEDFIRKRDHDQTLATAYLFAAAPEMLEALENLENDAGQIPNHAWLMIQNALAKAKGKEAL